MALLLAADVHLAFVQQRQHRHFAAWMEALTTWALSRHEELLTHPERAYEHTIVYRAPNWFQPDAAAPPLRRVA